MRPMGEEGAQQDENYFTNTDLLNGVAIVICMSKIRLNHIGKVILIALLTFKLVSETSIEGIFNPHLQEEIHLRETPCFVESNGNAPISGSCPTSGL